MAATEPTIVEAGSYEEAIAQLQERQAALGREADDDKRRQFAERTHLMVAFPTATSRVEAFQQMSDVQRGVWDRHARRYYGGTMSLALMPGSLRTEFGAHVHVVDAATPMHLSEAISEEAPFLVTVAVRTNINPENSDKQLRKSFMEPIGKFLAALPQEGPLSDGASWKPFWPRAPRHCCKYGLYRGDDGAIYVAVMTHSGAQIARALKATMSSRRVSAGELADDEFVRWGAELSVRNALRVIYESLALVGQSVPKAADPDAHRERHGAPVFVARPHTVARHGTVRRLPAGGVAFFHECTDQAAEPRYLRPLHASHGHPILMCASTCSSHKQLHSAYPMYTQHLEALDRESDMLRSSHVYALSGSSHAPSAEETFAHPVRHGFHPSALKAVGGLSVVSTLSPIFVFVSE